MATDICTHNHHYTAHQPHSLHPNIAHSPKSESIGVKFTTNNSGITATHERTLDFEDESDLYIVTGRSVILDEADAATTVTPSQTSYAPVAVVGWDSPTNTITATHPTNQRVSSISTTTITTTAAAAAAAASSTTP